MRPAATLVLLMLGFMVSMHTASRRTGSRATLSRQSGPTREGDELAAQRELRVEPPRLEGTARAADHEEPTALAASPASGPSTFDADVLAAMIHDGSRIERQWAEHVLRVATADQRDAVRSKREELERPGHLPEYTIPEVDSSLRIALRLRLLKVSEHCLRDLGIDMRGLVADPWVAGPPPASAHAYLDEAEIAVLERLMGEGGEDLWLEDEAWLRRAQGESGAAFLRASDLWPTTARGDRLPLGTAMRITPVLSADRRFVTVELAGRAAILSEPSDGGAVQQRLVLLTGGSVTVVMPVGATLLSHMHGVVWGPERKAGAPKPFVLVMVQAYLE